MQDSKRTKVLYVENEVIEQQLFTRFMEKNSIPFECKIVSSVAEALQILSCEKFDIVISDHDLGDGTALEVIAKAGTTPVIVVTGAGDEETAINALKAGAYDYLIKDIDQNYLKTIPITVEHSLKRKKTENQLNLLSAAVMSTEDSVYITDISGEIIFVNKALCKTYGYKEEEIVGQNSSILWIGRDQTKNTRSVIQTRTPTGSLEVGFYHRRKDDSIFPVSLSRATIKDSNKRDIAVVGVARDISERIQTEDKLRTRIRKLEEQSCFQSELATLVSISLQRLLSEGNISKAIELINGYVDISKINAHKVSLNLNHFSFSSLMQQVEEALALFAAEHKVTIQCIMPEDDLVIYADYGKTSQILSCLLNRAIKVSDEDPSVLIQVSATDDELHVEIHDSGRPLNNNFMKHISDSVVEIKHQFYTGCENLAFGLWLSRELVEMQGGHISLRSESIGKGNVVCFTIPRTVECLNKPAVMTGV